MDASSRDLPSLCTEETQESQHPHSTYTQYNQSFFCHLELGSDREVPDNFQSLLEVEFNMPAASASKTIVRSLSVQDRAELRKWVTYKAHYSYQER